MAAKHKLWTMPIQVIGKGVTKHRLWTMPIQVLWKDELYWGCDFISEASFTADLTVYPPILQMFAYWPLLGMKEILIWNTNIIRSVAGTEQRISIRPLPRQRFEISVYLKDEQEQAKMEAMLFGHMKELWGIPIWPENTIVDDVITAGDTSIYFDTANADYREGMFALLWQSEESWELLSVDSIESNHLVLSSAVGSTWTGRKWICPMRLAYIDSVATNVETADGNSMIAITFAVKNDWAIESYTATETYQGLTVLTKASLEERGRTVNIAGDITNVDYGLSMFNIFSLSDYNKYVQDHVFRNVGKAECWEFKKFLYSIYGRRTPFWVPTYKNDLQLIASIADTDVLFYINTVGWAQHMELNDLRTHLAFVFNDGSYIFKEIVSWSQEEDTAGNPVTLVGIDTALGVNVNAGDCQICFLDKCRLTEDRLELEFDEPFRNYCRTSLTRVVE